MIITHNIKILDRTWTVGKPKLVDRNNLVFNANKDNAIPSNESTKPVTPDCNNLPKDVKTAVRYTSDLVVIVEVFV
jgi:hypothetical protein